MSDVGQSNPPQDTPVAPSAPSVSIDTPLANPSDPTWPDSTTMANEQSQEASPSGQTAEALLANTDSAPPPDLANQEATQSGQVTEAQSPSAEGSQETTPSRKLANILSEATPPTENTPPEMPVFTSNTNDQSNTNQPSEVQSSPSESASSNQVTQTPPDLASIKLEPSQVPQETPLAKEKPQKIEENKTSTSPKSSFGEILTKDQQKASPSPAPTISPPQKSKYSFGDILGNLNKKQTKDTLPVEPSINIEPIVPPKPAPSMSLNPDKVVPSTQSTTPSINTSALRQKANQKRLDKKQKNLDKIMLFIKETKMITNIDVQRLCRVSQSTATNYLTELEKKGMIKQQGVRGGAKYTL